MAGHSEYDREPIFWIVKLLRARERRDSATEREAQESLKRLGVHVRFNKAPAKAAVRPMSTRSAPSPVACPHSREATPASVRTAPPKAEVQP